MATVTLDTKGKKCPMPVLMTKKQLKKMVSGDVLTMLADDKGSTKDVPALLNKTGDELLEMNEEGEVITFKIKKA
ncbi:MAG: sulfurtransferase TusA family protein [Candidatus Hodarchaeota archaeon]